MNNPLRFVLRSAARALASPVQSILGWRAGRDPYPAFADAFRTQRSPGNLGLIDEYKGIAYACANINARAFASNTFRLFATTGVAQAAPHTTSRLVSDRKQLNWLHTQKSLRTKLASSVTVHEILEHPSLKLLQDVSAELDGFLLFELTDLYQEITGTCYWYIERDEEDVPSAIWILPTQRVTPIYGENGIDHYDFGLGTQKQPFYPDEMIVFKFPNLRDPYGEGWSPVRAAYETINILNKDNAYASIELDNRGRPDLVMSPKDVIGENEAKRQEKRYAKKFRRGGNGGLIVVESGTEITPLNFTSKQMEALARRGVSKEDLANAFDTPLALLQAKEVNRATLEAALYQHAKLGILPRLTRFFQRLNQNYASLWDARLFFWFDNPVPDDDETKANVHKIYLDSDVMEPDEVRAELNLPPRGEDAAEDEGDGSDAQAVRVKPDAVLQGPQILAATAIVTAVAAGTIPRDSGIGQLVVLFNLTEEQANEIMGSADNEDPAAAEPQPEPPPPAAGNDPPPAAAAADDSPPEEENAETPAKMLDVLLAYHLKEISRASAIARMARLGASWQRAYNATEPGSVYVTPPALRSHVERDAEATDPSWHKGTTTRAGGGHGRHLPRGEGLKKAVQEIFARQRHFVLTGSKSQLRLTFTRLEADGKHVTKEVIWREPVDLSDWDHEMAEAARPFIAIQMEASGKEVLARLGLSDEEKKWNIHAPHVRQVIDRAAMRFSRETNQTTSMQINDAIAKLRDDLTAGITGTQNTPEELTKIVSDVFDQAEGYRAERIALTESSRAVHAGQAMAAKESGVVKGLKWLLSDDACAICQGIKDANPDGIPLDGSFDHDGGDGPYSDVPYPPAHPYCFVGETPVLTPGAVKAFRAMYKGPVLRIRFVGGAQVTVTPNHLFLTPAGFARASSLCKGDECLSYRGDDQRETAGRPDDCGQPTLIQQVVAALSEAKGMATSRVPVSPEYLHGDAAFAYGNIDVVASDGLLRSDGEPGVSQGGGDAAFVGKRGGAGSLFGCGDLASVLFRLRDATDGGLGGRSESPAFAGRESPHADALGFARTAKLDASFQKSATNKRPTDAKRLADALLTLVGKVQPLEVSDVEVDSFHGFVFDVQTESSLYIANGLIASNCMCTVTEILADDYNPDAADDGDDGGDNGE